MKSLILCILFVGFVASKPVAEADPQVYAYAPVYGYYTNPLAYGNNQFHGQDELGQYSYGYSNADSAKHEIKTADGIVQGSYSYVDANGILQTTNYISDALGFRVAATNLPVAPAAPVAEATVAEAVAPEPTVKAVEVTPVAESVPTQVNNVIVPYVQYAHLPYATAYGYPYYVAQPVANPIVPVAVQPQVAPVDVSVEQTYAAVEGAAVPATPQEIISVPIITQYHSQDELGQYQFSYSEPNANREETKTADGVVSGTYNYVDNNGVIQTVTYVADDQGFRASGASIPVDTGVAPEPVQDTPEVVAAREEHLRLVAEQMAKEAEVSATEAVPIEAVPAEVEAVPAEVEAVPAEVEPAQPVQPVHLPAPIAQNVYIATAQPAVQQVVVPQAYVTVPQTTQYIYAQPQTYATSQPVVAQPYLVGQPVAVSQPVAPLSSQYHAQSELGQYQYGYANEHSAKSEHRTADGIVQGSYSYVDANGVVQRVDYISDALGFRVAATNLPIQELPAEAQPEIEVKSVPEVIEVKAETPEVVAVQTEAPELYAVAPAGPVVAEAPEQVVQQVAVPYSQYLLPGYTAGYAPVYQPYAASYGYYYNPAYVGSTGGLTHVQHHAQDELGQYDYGYSTADSSKSEIKTADGIVQGTYSYVDANGILQTTNYISDALGFRVAATNLPVAVAPIAEAA